MSPSKHWTKRWIVCVAFVLTALSAAVGFAGSSEIDGETTATLDLYVTDELTTLGMLRFYGNDTIPTKTLYAALRGVSETRTDGAEDGTLILYVMKDGTLTQLGEFNGKDGKLVVNGDLDVHGQLNLDDMTGFEADDHQHALNDLSDVGAGPGGSALFLKWNGSTSWEAGQPAVSEVSGLQTALDGKLGTTAKAADSDKLDNYDSSAFPRKAENATITGQWTFPATGIQIGADTEIQRDSANSVKIPDSVTVDSLHVTPAAASTNATETWTAHVPSETDTGAVYTTTLEENEDFQEGEDWQNLSNAGGSPDTNVASVYLDWTESVAIYFHSFNFSSIPSGSTINGIVVTVRCKQSAPNSDGGVCVRLVDDDGDELGSNIQVSGEDITTTLQDWSFGNSSSLSVWGNPPPTVTQTMTQDSDFGCYIWAQTEDGDTRTYYVDSVSMRIYYTDPYGVTHNAAAGVKASDGSFRISKSLSLGTNDLLTIATDGTVSVPGDLSVTDDLSVGGDQSVAGELSVTGELNISGEINLACPLGPELLDDGGFDDEDYYWNEGDGSWDFGSHDVLYEGFQTTGYIEEQYPFAVVVGALYRVSYTVVANTGSGYDTASWFTLGGTTGAGRTSAGTYVEYVMATTTNEFRLYAVSEDQPEYYVRLDDVSVKRVYGFNGDHVTFDNDVWAKEMNAITFNDLTPGLPKAKRNREMSGATLDAVCKIDCDTSGTLRHETLPEIARSGSRRSLGGMITALTAAVQELAARNEELAARNEELEARVKALEEKAVDSRQ
ncbi:hypothetical protein JW916_14740 [Candidatus Sumerlaeota bacterium]|nr:hypothetical protein [Candidatus Sumerlaeota bacterium]